MLASNHTRNILGLLEGHKHSTPLWIMWVSRKNPAASADSRTNVPLVLDNATHDQVAFILDQAISIIRQMNEDIRQDVGHDDICLDSTPLSKSPGATWIFSMPGLSSIFS